MVLVKRNEEKVDIHKIFDISERPSSNLMFNFFSFPLGAAGMNGLNFASS